MSKIWSMMDVGKRSMATSQTALATVSHNVANKGTEGFSRQRVEIQATPPTGMGDIRIGTGARTTNVSRTNNQFIEKQLEKEGGALGNKESRAQSLGRVEQVFNEQINKGLNRSVTEFFNSFRELSNNPENLATRNLVKESADYMAREFQRVNSQLTQIQEEADFEIKVHVDEVNSLTKEIANLNERIQLAEMGAQKANDERDRRDLLVKKLGEKVNLRYAEGKDGTVVITAGSNAIIVSGSSSTDLSVGRGPEREGKRESNVEIYFKPTEHSAPTIVTKQFTGGAIGGALDVRDNFINEVLGQLDKLAFEVSGQVNDVHNSGFDRYNVQGKDFFNHLDTVKNASANFKLSDYIMEDAGRIAAAAEPHSPGDNRIANIISSMQFNQTMQGGEFTFDDFYNNIVGTVGVTTSRANNELKSQKDIVDQLTNIRESISGVSLDEETTKMIEYQRSFDASARLIKTADEMMQEVLNLKR